MNPPDFLIIPYQLLNDESIGLLEERLYGVIYWLTRLRNEKCTASNGTLAELCKTTPHTIQDALTKLESKGYITRRFKDSSNRVRTEIIPLISFQVSAVADRVSAVADTHVSAVADQNKKTTKKEKQNKPKGLRAKPASKPKIINNGRLDNRNKEVQDLVDTLKKKLTVPLDGSVAENRKYAKLILTKLKKTAADRKLSELNLAKNIIFLAHDGWHKTNATSMKYIYYHLAQIAGDTFETKPKYKRY
jgi:DNA-binding HxlR family transcriptional regulator